MARPYSGCRFCRGKGCLACDGERKRAFERAQEPIFTANLDDPHDMELLKTYFSKDAVDKAFSLDGGGFQEIQYNAAMASLLQFLHRRQSPPDDAPSTECKEAQ